jgi:hypothetical protein
MAQTFRSGTNDIEMFLGDEGQTNPDDLNNLYVLVNFRPVVTKKNWRMAVASQAMTTHLGYRRSSLPDCASRTIYRLWVLQEGIAAAHVEAAQNHIRSNYMRNPPTAEIFNEEVSNLLKRKIKDSLTRLDELSIAFDYEGEVTAQDAQEILDKIARLYGRALEAAATTSNLERADALRRFAANLQKSFYGFEPDFFQQNLLRIADDVISVIKGSIELWPSLVEICYFQKGRKGLPQVRVKNQKR